MVAMVDIASAATDGRTDGREERLEILVPSAPGGSRDVYARVIARHMSKYLPGAPAIIVKNMPGAGEDIILNYLYHRAKQDGTVFATIRGEVLQNEVVPRLLGVSNKTVTKVKAWFGK